MHVSNDIISSFYWQLIITCDQKVDSFFCKFITYLLFIQISYDEHNGYGCVLLSVLLV